MNTKILLLLIVTFNSLFISAQENVISLKTIHSDSGHVDFNARFIIDNISEFEADEVVEAYKNVARSFYVSSIDSSYKYYHLLQSFCEEKNLKEALAIAYFEEAQLLNMKSQYRESIVCFKKSLEYLPNNDKIRASTYLAISGNYATLLMPEMVNKYLDKAHRLLLDINYELLYSVLYFKLGDREMFNERLVSAIDYYDQSFYWAEKSEHPAMNKIHALKRMAYVYDILEEYTLENKYLDEALKIAEEKNLLTYIAQMNHRLAKHYYKLGDYDKSENYLVKAFDFYKSKLYRNRFTEVNCDLVEVNLKLGKADLAERYLLNAEQYVYQLNDPWLRRKFMLSNGAYQLERKNYEASGLSYKEAYDMAKQTGKFKDLLPPLKGLVNLAKAQNNIESALAFTEAYYAAKDSMYSLNQASLVYDYEGRYRKKEQDLEIIQLSEQNASQELNLRNRERQLVYSGGAFLFLLVIVSTITYIYRLNKKSLKLVSEKNAIISKTLKTNKMLLKEIHHRVKNNLQVVSSLLYLQSRYVKDKSAKGAISVGRSRVQAMSLLHQKLYQKDDVQKVDVHDYFLDLSQNLFETYKVDNDRIKFESDIEHLTLDVDTVIPLGLITNELISNALKHAFEDLDTGVIKLSLKNIDGLIHLIISDNGKGLPFNVIPEKSNSLGMDLIKSFCEKLNANLEIKNMSGCKFVITFLNENELAAQPA